MPFIPQADIDNADFSSPVAIQLLLDRLAFEIETLGPTDFSTGFGLEPEQQQPHRTIQPITLWRSIANGVAITGDDQMAIEIPNGLPPIEVFAAQAWMHSDGTVNGIVQLLMQPRRSLVRFPITANLQLTAVATVFNFVPFSVTLRRGDRLVVRVDTTAGATAFTTRLAVTFWCRIPLLSSPSYVV